MFLFRRQPQVQLSDESDSVCAWSLPCCVSRKYIQLPDDSDDEGGHPVRGIEEENDLLDAVDNNHFSQFNSHQMLSHNPFARSSIHHVLPTHEEQETLSLKQKNEVVVMEEAVEASEELVEISNRDPFKQYENEPDWTEIDEESDEEYNKELINTTYNNSNQCNQAEISTPLVSTDVPEMTVQEEEEEEEEVIPKNEQIPQLDEEVLHLLPLSQLSTDIPENLIHKRERSMYDDKESIFPYQSVNRMSTIFNSQSTEIMAISNTVSRDTLDSVSTNEIVTSPEMISSSSNTVEMISPKEGSSLAHTISDGLSYIKKNIIMNEDSYEAETSLKEVPKSNPRRHRRTSSLMDVAPTLARFINQISSEEIPTFSPSSLFSGLAGPMPDTSKRDIHHEEDIVEEEEEELFDFHKVIEITKNVKTFSEGMVGNGLRIINDVATRMKTHVENDVDDAMDDQEEGWVQGYV